MGGCPQLHCCGGTASCSCCLQEAAQQARAERVEAVAGELRRQQALQDQLVSARVAESLRQAQTQHQATLHAVRADCDKQLNGAQADHAAIMEATHAELQQTKQALQEVIDLLLLRCVAVHTSRQSMPGFGHK